MAPVIPKPGFVQPIGIRGPDPNPPQQVDPVAVEVKPVRLYAVGSVATGRGKVIFAVQSVVVVDVKVDFHDSVVGVSRIIEGLSQVSSTLRRGLGISKHATGG